MADLIYDEVELFVVCLLLGCVLAFIYDCMRILRMLFVHRDWVVDIEDLSFWILTAWLVFRTLFYYNRGALRGYAFLGMFLGVILYVLTASRMLMWLVGKLLPYWNGVKSYLRKPFAFLRKNFRKALKNIATEVTMAIKGR